MRGLRPLAPPSGSSAESRAAPRGGKGVRGAEPPALQRLVCLCLHTVVPPVRVSIVRQLQFRTTFVKLRRDPSRYVIDLKNHPDSPAARHKTAAHYRGAILPMAKIDRITELIDELRACKTHPDRWVFVNQDGQPFSSSAWTQYVRRCWDGFAPKHPPPSLCRTIFVTWLNGMPFHAKDKLFLEEVQERAARFQTHTLRTANLVYDKDAQSYERMLELVEFCEQWCLQLGGSGGDSPLWDENLDSDDERFDSTAPVARRRRRQQQEAPPQDGKDEHEDDDEEEAEVLLLDEEDEEPEPDGQGVPGPAFAVDGDEDPVEVPEVAQAETKLYLPEAILARNTHVSTKKKTGSKGGGSPLWEEWVLVKWAGYSVAEATWEPDVQFYVQHYPELLKAHDEARVPERLVGKRTHLKPGTGEEHVKVRWRGSKWTTMEPLRWVETRPEFGKLLQDFVVPPRARAPSPRRSESKARASDQEEDSESQLRGSSSSRQGQKKRRRRARGAVDPGGSGGADDMVVTAGAASSTGAARHGRWRGWEEAHRLYPLIVRSPRAGLRAHGWPLVGPQVRQGPEHTVDDSFCYMFASRLGL